MSWAKIDDRANEHPKLLKAGPKACWAWACGLMYCNRQAKKTGQIPKVVAHGMLYPGIGAREAAKLVAVGLWRDEGDHYEVHEHGQWNSEKRPSLTPEELSEVRAEAGRTGGRRSGESRREANEAKQKQNTEPIASEVRSKNGNQLLGSRTDAPAYAHRRALDPPHPTPPQEEDPLRGDPFSGGGSAPLPPTWDPGFNTFVGVPFTDATYRVALEQFRAHHCGKGTHATENDFRGRLATWATKLHQEGAGRRVRKAEELRQADDPEWNFERHVR